MVYRIELPKNENIDILDLIYIPILKTGYTLPPGIYETRDIDLMLQSLLPNDVEVKIPIDDIRLRSNSSTNKTMKF